MQRNQLLAPNSFTRYGSTVGNAARVGCQTPRCHELNLPCHKIKPKLAEFIMVQIWWHLSLVYTETDKYVFCILIILGAQEKEISLFGDFRGNRQVIECNNKV